MTAQINDVANKSFDYIIAGGGTAGLTIAAALSEDPRRSVLVLEAGGENIDDPLLMRPSCYGRHFGKPDYTWAHKTIPQKYADGVQIQLDRGKGLGGSSGINFYGWSKPPAEDLNDFERLGNPGWNWESLNHTLTKLEGFIAPKDEVFAKIQMKAGLWQLGTSGPLKISFPPKINLFEAAFQHTMLKLGFPPAPNPCGGDVKGYFIAPATHDPNTFTRSYATTAFYLPNKNRPNLTVLVNALVARTTIKPSAAGAGVVATGVEFIHGGKTYVAHANKEVIVCAGTLKSPQILELSGIGNPEILNKIGVPLKVDLPGVGENVQDHLLYGMSYELKDDPDFESVDVLADPAIDAKQLELYNRGTGIYTQAYIGYAFATPEMFTPKAAQIYADAEAAIKKKWDTLSEGRKEQYQLQLDRMKYGRPGVEFLTFPGNVGRPKPSKPGKMYFSLNVGNYHTLSSGNIHCTSSDPLQDPAYDPHYLEDDVDLQIMVEGAKYMRQVANSPPLKDLLVEELSPGPEVDSDEALAAHVKRHFYSPFHTSSSCSMLPREKGGVVDTSLKVYGTANLRVVDLSVIPVHIAAHTQATVYAVAAKAAEIILEEEKSKDDLRGRVQQRTVY